MVWGEVYNYFAGGYNIIRSSILYDNPKILINDSLKKKYILDSDTLGAGEPSNSNHYNRTFGQSVK